MSLTDFFSNDGLFSEFDASLTMPSPVVPRAARGRSSLRVLHRAFSAQGKVDVHEDKENNLVTATFELPGLNKENVSIDVHNNLLTVSGQYKFESDSNENGYLLCEHRFGRFLRSVPVPEGINLKIEETKASMENGVLTVTFPGAAAEQARKKITIS